MRKTFWIGLLVASCALVYVGCDTQQDRSPAGAGAAPTSTTMPERAVPGSGLTLPAGSRTWEGTADGHKVIWFQLPETHVLLGRVKSGEGAGTVARTPGGGITCTCTEGNGGCSPFSAHGPSETIVGCAMSSQCTTCVGEVSRLPGPDGQSHGALTDAVILDLTEPVSMVTTRAEAARLRCGSRTLLDDAEVVAALGAALRPFQGPTPEAVRRARIEDPADDVLMAPFNVYGHVMWMPVAASLDTNEAMSLPTSELVWDRYMGPKGLFASRTPDVGRCSCRSGSDGCAHHSQWTPLGSAEWCEAGLCDSCRLG